MALLVTHPSYSTCYVHASGLTTKIPTGVVSIHASTWSFPETAVFFLWTLFNLCFAWQNVALCTCFAFVAGVDYRLLMSRGQPLTVLLPSLADNNVHVVAKMAKIIPTSEVCSTLDIANTNMVSDLVNICHTNIQYSLSRSTVVTSLVGIGWV